MQTKTICQAIPRPNMQILLHSEYKVFAPEKAGKNYIKNHSILKNCQKMNKNSDFY